ncbi:relaxase/mobilization nuclease domain-containing protein [Sediminibacterium roseum]|uniref:Relaxase/mobilization nuclease domain-containing protein n=1 Tax=Sediminibacterium roseum TaxID=1978412 RepID=A0ABW9ZW65_9BACT|nr:relaxase/mobilization nuclease domain-containing protein [Sediminibacterium roseum]NCI51393.1 relaxase/mobilization nuclease domain-containing protein [Sediminibacterium roseum]
MVARITTPASLQKALNYHEKKVQNESAHCIGGNGFLLGVHQMNFYDKLQVFEYRNKLNERATTKTLHVSLNFSNAEKYDDAFLMQIAGEYMLRIGFGNQPYLVYHHHDAGHPHIHILSTTIREDGTRINTHNMGRNQSEIARKFLEEKYHLVKAENKNEKTHSIVPLNVEKVTYGISETKRGIANVLHGVLGTYNYTSLPELNAVLKQFNVVADRGSKDGFIYSKNGLFYRVLDANGNMIGVPVKASSIAGNPTLLNLEKRFEKNKQLRDTCKGKLAAKIDKALSDAPKSFAELTASLLKENVQVIVRQNAEGRLYGITFVDNQHCSVFNGSEIGRQYSVSALSKLMNTDHEKAAHSSGTYHPDRQDIEPGRLVEFNGLSVLAGLIKPEEAFNPTPYGLKKKKRKRKR